MYQPASIRSGLLIDSDRTSTYGWSLDRNGGTLYTQPITHRAIIVRPIGVLTANPSATPTSMRAIHWMYARRTFTRPDGTGRFRFTGWERSYGASSTSLMT